ncbi:hypothetical protein GGR57DRAFT_501908 [Xylariaceae sp. FL1272]|nr:hypothetical protein GGR57DRAFT_501908 [Xylariaceae sp. FL1272]
MLRALILAALWPLALCFSSPNGQDWNGDIDLSASNHSKYGNISTEWFGWRYEMGWARFCDTDSCEESGCGMWVDMGNNGCLNQMHRDRKAIQFKEMLWPPHATLMLLGGTTANCDCIAECMFITPNQLNGKERCWKIPEAMRLESWYA